MFILNDDLSIYATRGDIVFFSVTAEKDGTPYTFKAGDVVRIKVYGKKDAESVVLQKDFPVTEDCTEVEIYLNEEDTKIGDVISKHKDYWYEVELNPYNNPQTIIGYDEDGAKVFRLFPEGDDVPEFVPEPEDVAVMDDELDMTSTRPVQNQAIARAVTSLRAAASENKNTAVNLAKQMVASSGSLEQQIAVERARIDNAISGAAADDTEVTDMRIGFDGTEYNLAGNAVRGQFEIINGRLADCELSYDLEHCDWLKDCYVNNEGTVNSFPTQGYVNCCYIPVQKGDVVSFSSTFGTMAYLVDGNKNPIKSYTKIEYGFDETDDTAFGEVTDTITIPAGYVILNASATSLNGYYFNISRKADKTLLIEVQRLENLIVSKTAELAKDELNGKRINFLGDSITAGVFLEREECYVHLIAEKTGAVVANLGVSGSKVSDIANDEVPSFVDRLVDVPDGEFTVIFGGTNDYWHKVTDTGTAESEDAGTFGGALNHIFDYLHTNFPAMKILYVFPFHQYADGADTTDFGHGTFNDFRLCAKAVCENHGIPMLDLYSCGGINPAKNEAQRTMFTLDGYHLNPAGHKLLSEKVIGALKRI